MLERAVSAADIPWRKGRFASFDGFYRDMFSLEADTRERVAEVRNELLRQNVLVTDMESSALFTAGRALGVEAGSLCVATVDSETQVKIDGEEMDLLERRLFLTALDALASLQPAEPA
jgi:uridine phosphorylase